MKIRVVSSRKEMFILNSNERIVHLAFRPSNKDILGLVETCPKIEAIQLPQSYRRSVSKSTEMFLEMQKVQLLEGDVWGHRKDICEYYEIPSSIIKEIADMKYKDMSTEDILKIVSRKTKMNPEMVAYILTKEFTVKIT
jgi:hypothetical protein